MAEIAKINWKQKINSPDLLAFLEQFGKEHYLDADEINEFVEKINALIDSTAEVVSYKTVETYADLLEINAGDNLLIIKVLNDENKIITNTIYQLYPDGVRMWIAANKDN